MYMCTHTHSWANTYYCKEKHNYHMYVIKNILIFKEIVHL